MIVTVPPHATFVPFAPHPQSSHSRKLIAFVDNDENAQLDWLKSYLEQNPPDAVALCLFAHLEMLVTEESMARGSWDLLIRLVDRVRQLQQIRRGTFELVAAPFVAILKCALYIETTLEKTKKVFVEASASKLLWDLQTDTKTNVYLIARKRYSAFQAQGGQKSIVLAAQCSMHDVARTPALVVQTLMEKSETDATLMLQAPSTVRLITTVKVHNKVSCILQRYDMTGFEYISQYTLTLPQKLLFANAILTGLVFVHQKMRAHLDVKLENLLLNSASDGTLCETALADFGFASSEIDTSMRSVGTKENFAPEMVGAASFCNDKRMADIWAAGCLLYRVEFKAHPPWTSKVQELVHLQSAVSTPETQARVKELRHSFHTIHTRTIEGLIEAPGSLQAMSFRHLIAKMIAFKPDERLTAKSALDALKEVQNDSVWASIKRFFRVLKTINSIAE